MYHGIKIKAIICLAFLTLSILCCVPEQKTSVETKHELHSSQLTLQITEEADLKTVGVTTGTNEDTETESEVEINVGGTVRRETYVDKNGIVTFASDKYYASVVKQLDEAGRTLSEYYYDEIGQPAAVLGGQYGVLREYDEKGQEVKLTYVNEKGKPIRVSSGYTSVLKTYDENGHEVNDTYVNENLYPVYRVEGYAGQAKEYDDNGWCFRITNLDIFGNPVNNNAGIAVEERTPDMEGRLFSVMYFDINGCPAMNMLWQYGEAYAYDKQGRRFQTTYLDSKGNPAPNKDGYTILRKTYKADGSADAEMYFDANGEPVRLNHGEYGIRWENGQKYYLTKSGKVYFLSLKKLLHAHSVLVILIGFLICLLALFLPKSVQTVLLVLYVAFIVYMTILYRTGGIPEGQFELFWSYKEFFWNRSIRVELFQNIWLFVPLGALLYFVLGRRRLWMLLPLLLSVVIEIIQYVTGRGLFEFDDMISNVLGGCIGFWIGELITVLFLKRRLYSIQTKEERI